MIDLDWILLACVGVALIVVLMLDALVFAGAIGVATFGYVVGRAVDRRAYNLALERMELAEFERRIETRFPQRRPPGRFS